MKYKISAVIPLYNAEKYIERTLESVLRQVRIPDEIIIVDDGSVDKGPTIARNTLEQYFYKNYKIVKTINMGHASAANTGVSEATGDYVALIDSDDTWELSKLLKVSQYLENEINPSQVIFSKFKFIDEFDQIYHHQNMKQEFNSKNFWQKLLIEGNVVYGSNSGVVIKRESFLSENGYDTNLHACEDWDLWIRLAKKYSFTFFSESLVNIRVHSNNQSANKELMMNYLIKVMAKHRDDIRVEGLSFLEIIKMILMQQGKMILKFYFSKNYKFQREQLQEISGLRFIRIRTFFPIIGRMISNTIGRICIK